MSESLCGRKSDEMTRSNTSHGGWKFLLSPRGGNGSCCLRMKRFVEEERIEGEKESILLSIGEERIGGARTLNNESEEDLFSEMLTPT